MVEQFSEFKEKVDIGPLVRELDFFIEWLLAAPGISDQRQGGIDTYSTYMSDFLDAKLTETGFANGEPAKNTIETNPGACFWFALYRLMHGICYPLFDHHATTRQRQQNDILKIKCVKNELLGKKTSYTIKRGKVIKVYDYSPVGTHGQIIEVKLATKRVVFYPE